MKTVPPQWQRGARARTRQRLGKQRVSWAPQNNVLSLAGAGARSACWPGLALAPSSLQAMGLPEDREPHPDDSPPLPGPAHRTSSISPASLACGKPVQEASMPLVLWNQSQLCPHVGQILWLCFSLQ